MAVPAKKRTTEYPTVMPAEMAREMFDRAAEVTVGLSGDEFLRRYDAGEYRTWDDTPEGRQLFHLVSIIPFVRQDS